MTGKVINFYSFKGGVGRTITLIKVSERLKACGFSVAVVDMDLECPGYSIIESLRNMDKRAGSREKRPTISLLEIAKQYLKILIDDNKSLDKKQLNFSNAKEYIFEKITPYLKTNFLIIPAYSRGLQQFSEQDFEDYVEHLKYLEFNEFSKIAGSFLEALITPLKNKFDYVLIDNRTGLSETSIWNLRKFSDLTVWVFTLSLQNIEGIRLTYGRYSKPIEDDSSGDYNKFIFVANITPPIPELSQKHMKRLAKILNIPVSKIINIPYAPQPILNELFPFNEALERKYEAISSAILEENELTPFFQKRYSKIKCSFFSLSELENQFSAYQSVSSTILGSIDYNKLLKEIDGPNEYSAKLELISMLFQCLFKNKAFGLLIDNFKGFRKKEYIKNGFLPDCKKDVEKSWLSIMTQAYQASIIISDPIQKSISTSLDYVFLGCTISNFQSYLDNFFKYAQGDNYFIYLNTRLFHLYNNIKRLSEGFWTEKEDQYPSVILSLFKVWFLLSSNNIAITSFVWPPKKANASCLFDLINKMFTMISPDRNLLIFNSLCYFNKDAKNGLIPQRILSLLLKIQSLYCENLQPIG